ncbi:MAG: GGDEF domain-containing protein [Pseudomonadota bacterium]
MVDLFHRSPTLVPVVVAVAAVVLAILFASMVVASGLHQDGAMVIGFAAVISIVLAVPAGYIQYSREKVYEAQKTALHGLASTDSLTGIMNRRSFSSAVRTEQARMIRSGDTAALILFDLDWFKRINDSYGHDAGDKILISVAKVAWAELRNPLDYLARWGGEEFAIFLNGVDLELADRAAERLRLAIEMLQLEIADTKLMVTASFGITLLTSDCNLEDAMRRADRALYAAKREGRNRSVLAEIDSSGLVSSGQAA